MGSRENMMFNNRAILDWLEYFATNANLDLEKVKILDITGKNKNLIPTVMTNPTVLVLTDAGHPDIFYSMWNSELGDCDIWYNEGSDPSGPIKHDRLADMINRGINASAGMVIHNPNATSTYPVGMDNENFVPGSIPYVSKEIRSVIINKLHISAQDVLCVISGESIAVEAAMQASEGDIIAVEYHRSDLETMEANAEKFGLNNVHIVSSLEADTLSELPVPTIAFIVASTRLEHEIATLIERNPNIKIVVYTLELKVLAKVPTLFEQYGITDTEVIQASLSKLNSKDMLVSKPSPWIISGTAGEHESQF